MVRILEPLGTWYWHADGDNRSYEWNPPGFPDRHRQCFSWKWKTNLKRDCFTCEQRLRCLTIESNKCSLVLETRLTFNVHTGQIDEYEAVKREPYV